MVQVGLDPRVFLDLFDQILQVALYILSPPGRVQMQGIAAQTGFLFHQENLVTLIGQFQGGTHAGEAAADHQAAPG